MIKTIQYVISVCIFSLLFISLLAGLAPNLSSKVVALGESIWPNYAQDLRKDLPEPECPLEDLQQKVSQCPADVSNIPTNTSKSDDVDPFADNTEEDPFADDIEEDPFGDDTEEDPFADDVDKKETDKKEIDPFADDTEEDPFGDDTEEDPFG